jgi:hypothetical protein
LLKIQIKYRDGHVDDVDDLINAIAWIDITTDEQAYLIRQESHDSDQIVRRIRVRRQVGEVDHKVRKR